MPITKRNHYIPCMFTAFWNFDYYSNKLIRETKKARKQNIFSLNLKSNKILETTTENVFFEKGMGIAKINHDSILDFVKRNKPDEYLNVLNSPKEEFDDLIIDFENVFTAIDNIHGPILRDIILKNNIENISDKTWIASFISDLYTRNYQNQKLFKEEFESQQKPKFELFWELKNVLGNEEELAKMIIPLVASEWILYRETMFKFPICDTPLLINKKNILFALSPTMLLRIEYHRKTTPEDICKTKNKVSSFIYKEYMKRMLISANREIIFSDLETLKELQNLKQIRNKKNEC